MIDALTQRDLLPLSECYDDFVSTVYNRDVSDDHLNVAGIVIRPDGKISLRTPRAEQPQLKGILLLRELTNLKDYSRTRPDLIRANVATVARLGSLSIKQIHEETQRKGVEFSIPVLAGLYGALRGVHDRMDTNFASAIRSISKDQEAYHHLISAGSILARDLPG